jgi:hypothetical protein
MQAYYRLNAPDVSAEDFDGEVLAINLKNGHYHSLRGAGFQVWTLLIRGYSLDETIGIIARTYPNEAKVAAEDSRKFVMELVSAQLIVPMDGPIGSMRANVDLLNVVGPYMTPVLESYTDMQELLLIDPIHEVDVLTGWPHKPGEAEHS